MEGLLVRNAQGGQDPHKPSHRSRPVRPGQIVDRQPREVRPGYENVDHSPITAMQDIFQLSEIEPGLILVLDTDTETLFIKH